MLLCRFYERARARARAMRRSVHGISTFSRLFDERAGLFLLATRILNLRGTDAASFLVKSGSDPQPDASRDRSRMKRDANPSTGFQDFSHFLLLSSFSFLCFTLRITGSTRC